MPKENLSASELSPRFAILGFLYLQPMHGYDLHKRLERELREVWRISQSQAYAILKSLDKDGWVAATHQPQEKRPDRDLLSITALGREQFARWLRAPTPGSARAIRVEFLTRMYFAAQACPGERTRLVEEQGAAVRENIVALSARLDHIPPGGSFNRLGLDLRIRQLSALVEWIEENRSFFTGEAL